MTDGRLVVVDATNVEAAARRPLIRLARDGRRRRPRRIVIAAPSVEVHARNAGRAGRVVPADVVDRHLAGLSALGATADEIASRLLAKASPRVRVLSSDEELDAVRVVLVRGSAVADPAEGSRPELDPHAIAQIDVGPADLERGLLVGGPDEDDRG